MHISEEEFQKVHAIKSGCGTHLNFFLFQSIDKILHYIPPFKWYHGMPARGDEVFMSA